MLYYRVQDKRIFKTPLAARLSPGFHCTKREQSLNSLDISLSRYLFDGCLGNKICKRCLSFILGSLVMVSMSAETYG